MTMDKKKYISPAVSFIDMKTYGIMEIQGESRFRVDTGDDLGDETQIIEGDPTGGIDAKYHDVDLWADEEPVEDVF
jgi:hypothetical protein